jgi:putative FmdB family regulatory protein
MPTYEYECTSCHQRVEVEQRFSDEPLTTCENCGGALRKVFSAVGVVFKGSGFYKTDSRSSTKATGSPKEPSSTSAAGDAAPASTSPSAPASTPAPTPSPASPASEA